MEGIFIPKEFNGKGLSDSEKFVLAVYKYYTEEGKGGCCMLSNDKVGAITDKTEKTVQRAKKRLKDLGLIKTNGGICVVYTGFEKDKNVLEGGQKCPVVDKNVLEGGQKCPVVDKNVLETDKNVLETDKNVTHNKENKENKEQNKEINKEYNKEENKEEVKEEVKEEEVKQEMTNFDRLIDMLPNDYKEQEKVDFLKKTYSDYIIKWNDISYDEFTPAIYNILQNLERDIKKEFYSQQSIIPNHKTEFDETEMFDGWW